jgi:hypothetical protein
MLQDITPVSQYLSKKWHEFRACYHVSCCSPKGITLLPLLWYAVGQGPSTRARNANFARVTTRIEPFNIDYRLTRTLFFSMLTLITCIYSIQSNNKKAIPRFLKIGKCVAFFRKVPVILSNY